MPLILEPQSQAIKYYCDADPDRFHKGKMPVFSDGRILPLFYYHDGLTHTALIRATSKETKNLPFLKGGATIVCSVTGKRALHNVKSMIATVRSLNIELDSLPDELFHDLEILVAPRSFNDSIPLALLSKYKRL